MAESDRPRPDRASAPFSLFAVLDGRRRDGIRRHRRTGARRPRATRRGTTSRTPKKNEATKKAEIDRVTDLLAGLRRSADEASKQSQIAAEAYRERPRSRWPRQQEREKDLRSQADAAAKTAKTSQMRAGTDRRAPRAHPAARTSRSTCS